MPGVKRDLKNEFGFTLIELLIVISIITILILILFVSFTQVQKNARDSQRKSDLQTVAGALQRFYSDYSHYPGSDNGEISYNSSNCDATTTDGNPWGQTTPWIANVECNGKNYLKFLMSDPIGSPNYCYESTSSEQNYNLYAHLEGKGNLTTNVDCGGSTGTPYNYRVTAND